MYYVGLVYLINRFYALDRPKHLLNILVYQSQKPIYLEIDTGSVEVDFLYTFILKLKS